jgi:negative regulator of flagellin synthesis FlgM
MRIPSGPAGSEIAPASAVSEITRIEGPASVTPAAGASAGGAEATQSAALEPAMAALRAMPDVDQARVAALRAALAKGELPFDANKLAALIERYHRVNR